MSSSRFLTVGILGCGWLGRALAEKLLKEGVKVKGTTTSTDKLKDLEALGITPYQIEFLKDKTIGSVQLFLENIESLIISVPPRYTDGDDGLYHGLKRILEEQNLEHIQKIIYVSSTGVFEDGEHCVYNEESPPNASSNKGNYLIQLENLFHPDKFKQEVTVLRFGGLIKNEGRHPVHYLAGKTDIANPEGVVNLIEQKDTVRLIYAILLKEKLKPFYHGVYPWHPSRKTYYTQKANELGLKPPEFKDTEKSIRKEINSKKTSTDLNFKFLSKI